MFYIVMEYVEGANLRQAIQAGGLTPQAALAIVPQICEALQFAHDEGIVHRDIKPENILIDKRGRVKIADFGLAKLLGQDASDHSLTATHQVMGTLRYTAPEQMQASREVDHRADIYSLGVVFYELLTGELPMGKFAPRSKRAQVDVRLDEIVLRALEQEPEQRYQNASDSKSDVENVTSKPKPMAVPPPSAAVLGDDHLDVEYIRPKQLGALPSFFWLASFGMLMLGWSAVAALSNYGLAGFLLGSVVMAAITEELVLFHARRNLRRLENWRTANAWKRFTNLLGMIIPLTMSFMMLNGGMGLGSGSSMPQARTFEPSREEFEARYKGKEYQLIRRLDAFKEHVPAVELSIEGYSGSPITVTGGPVIAWLNIGGGLLSLYVCFCGQLAPRSDPSSVWKILRRGWRPALVCTGAVLGTAAFANVALSVVRPRYHSGVAYTSVQNTVVLRATTTVAHSALHRWAAENGYTDGPRCRWSLQAVPRGELVGRVDCPMYGRIPLSIAGGPNPQVRSFLHRTSLFKSSEVKNQCSPKSRSVPALSRSARSSRSGGKAS